MNQGAGRVHVIMRMRTQGSRWAVVLAVRYQITWRWPSEKLNLWS